MDKKVSDLLNQQINKEFYSAYLYLDIANYYSAKGLDGFANWYEIQAREEQDHAMLFYKYLQNNDKPVVLTEIAKPDKEFENLMAPLQVAFEHEKYVTSLINTIYSAAVSANDYRTTQFLDWFIKEQGEEEKNSSDQITKMELYGGDSRSLYMLTRELLARAYAAPSLVI
ncbi:MAG: ferritin [Clostridiales bacterium]|nr:ferritin [Clostridiales bacterium]